MIRPLRDGIAVGLIVLLSASVCLWVVNEIAQKSQMDALRSNLLGYANAAAGLVDGDLHEQLTQPDQTGSETYRKAIEPLVQMHKRVPDIAYLYSFVEKDGKLHFVLDTATQAKRLGFGRDMKASSVMDLYESDDPEEDAREAKVVRGGEPYSTMEPVSDEFGTFLSGLAPIYDSAGKPVGAVGVDLDVSEVIRHLNEAKLASRVGMGVAAVVALIVALVVWKIRIRALVAEKGRMRAMDDQKNAKIEQALLIEALGEVVYHHDLVSDRIDYAGSCERVLGFRSDQMHRNTQEWFDSLHPEDRPHVIEMFETAKREQSIFEIEYRTKRADGTLAWVQDRGVLTFDASGKALCMDGVMLDITLRRQSDERFRVIFEGSTEPHMLVDASGVIDCNQAAIDLLGYKEKSEMIRQPLTKFWPEFQADGRSTLEHAQELKSLTEARGMHRMEVLKRSRTGELIPVEVSATYVNIRGARMMLVVWHDLRQIKRAQNELALSESKFRDLVQNLDLIVYQTNLEGRLTFLNSAWERLAGFPVDSCLGRDYADFVLPEDLSTLAKARETELQGNFEFQALTFRVRTRDDRVIWLEGYCRARKDADGTIIGTSGTLGDVTSRKISERELIAAKDAAETANRAKSEFLAVMSHEIRTPLNGVLGFANLLSHTRLDVTQQEYLKTISGCGDALLTIIDDILDFSRMESGRFELESHPFDLRECVETVLDVHGTRAYAQKLELVSEFHENVPTAVVGDEGRLRQVLSNLVGNAVKFTESGEVVVRTRLAWVDRGHVTVEMSVRDTGIGIEREKLGNLFRPFVQADSSMSRRFGGAGLGLAICRRLVRAMGGDISVRSEVGAGSTFTFTVSLKRHLESEEQMAASFAGRRILIVEKNAAMVLALRSLLVGWGIDVAASKTREEFDALLDGDGKIDLAMIDSGFAGPDDIWTITDELTQRNIPILLVVPIGVPASEQPAHFPNEWRRLSKPLHTAVLRMTLEALFSKMEQAGQPAVAILNGMEETSDALPSADTKILVVEDNVVNQKLVRRMLGNLGYEAEIASNGRVALGLCDVTKFDVIFMDIQMPELDGFETTRRLREQGGRAWIVALTAHVLSEDRERCIDAGMNDFLPKPIRIEDLKTSLARFKSADTAEAAS